MTPSTDEPRRTRAPLTRYLGALAISLAGTELSLLALPWFVLVTTGSAARTGVIAACEMAPYVAVQVLGGPLIDRIGARRVSVTSDLASALVVGAIPALHAIGALHFDVLAGLVALAGATRGPGDSAKSTLVPDVVARAGVRTERVTGLVGAAERMAGTVGPAFAGVLIAWRGPLAAMTVDAVTFAVCAVLIATLHLSRVATPSETDHGYTRALRAGFTFLRSDPLLRAIVAVIATTNLLDAAMFSVLLPVWTRDHGHGPAAIGLIASAFGATALAGSVVAAVAGHRLPRRVIFVVGYLVVGIPRFAVLALGAPLSVVVAVHVLAGFGAGFLNPITHAITLERIPAEALGRVTSLIEALTWSGIPLGGLVGGALIAAAGLASALWVCGAVYLAATIAPALRPAFREMDQPVSGSRLAACNTATSNTAIALPKTAPPMP
ncbi:MAG TPA: MFS transporter [Acidimicrobiia bacterium]|nr:MFS transporter [Acidimicrobiia bacterium]